MGVLEDLQARVDALEAKNAEQKAVIDGLIDQTTQLAALVADGFRLIARS